MCENTNRALCLVIGMAIGIFVGYQNEEGIDELARSTRKAKRKMIRKMNDVKDHFEM